MNTRDRMNDIKLILGYMICTLNVLIFLWNNQYGYKHDQLKCILTIFKLLIKNYY